MTRDQLAASLIAMNYIGSPACGAAAAVLMINGWMSVGDMADRMNETSTAVRVWLNAAVKKHWLVAQLVDGVKLYHITETGARVTNKLLCPSLKNK